MAWALSMGKIRSKESEFERASSGPTSLRHRATGSKRIRQTRARPGRLTGCRTSHEFADRGDRQIGKMALKEFGPTEKVSGLPGAPRFAVFETWDSTTASFLRFSCGNKPKATLVRRGAAKLPVGTLPFQSLQNVPSARPSSAATPDSIHL